MNRLTILDATWHFILFYGNMQMMLKVIQLYTSAINLLVDQTFICYIKGNSDVENYILYAGLGEFWHILLSHGSNLCGELNIA